MEAERDDIRIIDWEYAGMQDPHVDLAMFSFIQQAKIEALMKLTN